jgi:polysaccharide export outer membrane protein
VATDSDTYIVGPEDVLYISVWKEEALSKTVTVRMDGKISLPLIDEIQAAGQTPLRLKEILTKRFQEFIDAPNVSVMVMEANSYKVYISGQVRTPGVIRLRSETSLAQVISMAGGFTDLANEKKIMVVRKENGQQKIMTVIYKPKRPGADPQLEQLRRLLVELEAKYTQKHPDIKTTKRMIANLEQKDKPGSGEENSEGQDLGASLILKAGDTIIVP